MNRHRRQPLVPPNDEHEDDRPHPLFTVILIIVLVYCVFGHKWQQQVDKTPPARIADTLKTPPPNGNTKN